MLEQTHDHARVRAELDARQEVVEGRLRRVRHLCRGLYGDDGVARLGLKVEPPSSAFRLHGHGMMVKESLENPELGLKPLIKLDLGEGVASPAAQLAAQLEPGGGAHSPGHVPARRPRRPGRALPADPPADLAPAQEGGNRRGHRDGSADRKRRDGERSGHRDDG